MYDVIFSIRCSVLEIYAFVLLYQIQKYKSTCVNISRTDTGQRYVKTAISKLIKRYLIVFDLPNVQSFLR